MAKDGKDGIGIDGVREYFCWSVVTELSELVQNLYKSAGFILYREHQNKSVVV